MRLRELYTGTKPFSYIIFTPSDANAAEMLLDNLDNGGYRYWFNPKLTPNEKDLNEILSRMKSAAVTVLVLTPNIVQDEFITEIVNYSLEKRTPLVVYVTEQTPEIAQYLNSVLERTKSVVVFREWEQKFNTSNSLRQALSQTKGVTLEEAQTFFEKGLAALGDPEATQESLVEGMKCVMYAAANEYAPALNFLGNVSLEKARNGQDSYSSAVFYYKNAIKLGNIESIYTLGCLIADGEGFAQNYNVAQGYISLAALQGIPDAQFRFAEMLDKGNGVVQNKTEATVWYKKALDGGDRRAYLPLAYRYLDGETLNRNETVAAQYFTEAAEDGSTDAILMLAKLYRDGVGVKKDSAKSETYFRKAAEREIAEAQYEYALILQGKKNYTEAFKWLSYAAMEREYGEQPMPAVLYKLGQCYGMGLGTEIDRQSAFLYYHKAALAGDVNACAAVADCYKRGIGVTVNKRAAEFFANGMQ